MPPLPPGRMHALLTQQLAEKDVALRRAAQGDEEPTEADGKVSVVIGTSQLSRDHPGLEERLTEIIERSYAAVSGSGPRMLERQPISVRLQMGDYGTRANRVLHVAFSSNDVVGCISSSFATLWTEPGVGHWGLLVVDVDRQGEGIGSALVRAAERRLAEEVEQVHIEYDFIVGQDYSHRLRGWYEKCGYIRLGARTAPGPKGSEFCFCRKQLTKQEIKSGRRRRLETERAEILAQLGELGEAWKDSDAAVEAKHTLASQVLFDRLTAVVKADGATMVQSVGVVFQFVIVDAGPEGRFILDLKHGSGLAKVGEDSKPECTIMMKDDDLAAWSRQSVDGMHLFWCGRLRVKGDGEAVQKLMPIFSLGYNL